MSSRRQDPKTGKIYNLVTDKPPVEVDINSLVQRDDDKPEAIKQRLGWYGDRVRPFIEHLKNNNIKIVEIDGMRSIEEIQMELVSIIEEVKNAKN